MATVRAGSDPRLPCRAPGSGVEDATEFEVAGF
jgi:hypothetical protein